MRDGVDELFKPASWQSVFDGMGIRPEKYCPRIDTLDYEMIENVLKEAEQAIDATVQELPSHDQFLRKDYGAL
jgi:tryptophan halogenase